MFRYSKLPALLVLISYVTLKVPSTPSIKFTAGGCHDSLDTAPLVHEFPAKFWPEESHLDV